MKTTYEALNEWDRLAATPKGMALLAKVEAGQLIDEITAHTAKTDVSAPCLKLDEWPDPIPFSEVALPTFPVNLLPRCARDYVIAVANSLQVPVDMAAVAALAVSALSVQHKYVIEGKPDWREPLNLYTVVIAPPAERKSAVADKMTRPIHEYEKHANELLRYEIDYYESARTVLMKELKALEEKAAHGKVPLMDAVNKRTQLEMLKPVKPLRLWTDDATPEAVVSLMAENDGRIAVISAEGGLFEIMAGRYTSNGVNIDAFLKAHSGDAIRVDRKARSSEYIRRPAMTLLLFIQNAVLGGLMGNETFRGRGLVARFLYSIPTSKVGTRIFETAPIPADIEEAFQRKVSGLLEIPMPEEEHVLRLSPDAYRLSAQFARALEPRLIGDLEPISDWAGKLHGVVLRIAGVLHCMESDTNCIDNTIPGTTIKNAIDIGAYFLEHAKAAYKLMGADQQSVDARRILHVLRKERKTEITRAKLISLCRFATADNLNPAINLLIENGYIRTTERSIAYNNRKQITYLINPKVYANDASDALDGRSVGSIASIVDTSEKNRFSL